MRLLGRSFWAYFGGKLTVSKPDTPEVKSVFLDGSIVNKDERFSMDDNFVLTIHDVQVFDEGNYSCQLETVQGEDSINFTQLTIYGKLIQLTTKTVFAQLTIVCVCHFLESHKINFT